MNPSIVDGRKLAVKMLREQKRTGADACCIEPEFRARKAQAIPILRYLEILQEKADPALTRGFSEVLSDYLASDGVPDLDIYIATYKEKAQRRLRSRRAQMAQGT